MIAQQIAALRVAVAQRGNLEPDVLLGGLLLRKIGFEVAASDRAERVAAICSQAEFARDYGRGEHFRVTMALIEGRGFTG